MLGTLANLFCACCVRSLNGFRSILHHDRGREMAPVELRLATPADVESLVALRSVSGRIEWL